LLHEERNADLVRGRQPRLRALLLYREQRQYGHDPSVVRRSKTRFDEPLRWDELQIVFTCSWSDWFHPGADEGRDEAWAIVRDAPHLTYSNTDEAPRARPHSPACGRGSGYANVWLGVSIENSRFTWRADELRAIPAAVRFISAEPLIGSLFESRGNRRPLEFSDIDWLIVGGESGPCSRRLDITWADEIATVDLPHRILHLAQPLLSVCRPEHQVVGIAARFMLWRDAEGTNIGNPLPQLVREEVEKGSLARIEVNARRERCFPVTAAEHAVHDWRELELARRSERETTLGSR
jgi:protein gp37